VRERVTALEGGQASITQSLVRIETMLVARAPAQAPQETAAALALHRAADLLEKRLSGSTGTTNPLTLFLSGVGLLAIGGGAAWAFFHH
jgi:hypothetical protein